jgi:hypothetical protein
MQFFLLNVYSGSKFCPALLETVGPCVLNQNFGEFTCLMGDLKCGCCPSAICALMASVISKDIGILNGKCVCLTVCQINYANCRH